MAFKQTKSISRRLTFTLVAISTFFLVELAGLYFSGQNFLLGFAHLHQVNGVNESLEQATQIINSIKEKIVAAKGDASKIDPEVFEAANRNAMDLLAEAQDSLTNDNEDRQTIQKVQKSMRDLRAILERAVNGPPLNPNPDLLVAEQFTLEIAENMRKIQIDLNHRGNQIFDEVYESRFEPLFIGLTLALLLITFAIFLSLRLSRHIDLSLQILLGATEAISRGDLDFQAPVIEPDELGKLTFAFNEMSRNLRETTVSRNYFEGILESMLDPVIVLDPKGAILRTNQITSKTFGYTAEELVGRSAAVMFAEPFDIFSQERSEEGVCLAKDGRRVPVSISISRLKRSDGKIVGLVCGLKDLTEIKKAEAELKNKNVDLANANRELEAFSYSVSHDLRSPLRSIDGFSQALLEDCVEQLNPDGKDYLARIRSAVQRMGHLIDDLLNLSRITRAPINPSRVDLSKIAHAVIQDLQQQEPDRKVDVQIQEGVVADADPVLMKIVLENLLGNAWKYTSKHGQAHIQFGTLNLPEKGRTYFVRDDGAGFNMSYSPKLFGAFQRLHTNAEFPGTGVGLATVQRIIHRHGGSIWAEGEVEKGATFYFKL